MVPYLMYSITEVIDCSVRRGIFTMNFSIAITMILCAKFLICAHQVNGSKYHMYLLTNTYLLRYFVMPNQIDSNFVPSFDGTLAAPGANNAM